MLYTSNLEELIFNRHQILNTDELIVLSGYLGPRPVERLGELPFNTRVIYGMYGSDGIQRDLHNSLVGIQNNIPNVNIFYSNSAVHSKCYIWRRNGAVIYALIGSANFSINGLTTPFREVLAETTQDTFTPLNDYVNRIFNDSISCLEAGAIVIQDPILNQEVCSMTLLMNNGEVHNASGLNWGYTASGQPAVKRGINDACIPIRVDHIENYPTLFPPKLIERADGDFRGRRQRDNEAIEIIWDDGITMEGLLEGTQPVNDLIYPKQISSFPTKSQLGVYIKNRIGVPLGQPVRAFHLEQYGRTDIDVSSVGPGIYKFDFSV